MADPKEKKDIKLVAVEPILHDGEKIAPGETFMTDNKQADRLLKKKRAEKVK
ncbi:DUF7210 family protein [Desulfobacula phenolica]|uniref:DUF7210 domain-containing protein n=1 Tax=Desulfobacula phenolica TaxID=90732 RepID=A0A1H2H4W6_9BACT|nr:hypothetical protein [Desulfobacula phenolica]SDU26779.1 hypothetical protein SAMN04487931_10643 [Desulfobacula phenolica]